MDSENLTRYDDSDMSVIRKAYEIAQESLSGQERSDGSPMLGHPVAVAKIVYDEIGLPAECIAAVFLHEAMRFNPAIRIVHEKSRDKVIYPSQGQEFSQEFAHDVLNMVEGLNKISTIRPKDTKLEAENYKKLIVSYSTDPRVTVLKLADRLEVMRSLHIFPKLSRERKIMETLMLYIPLAHQLGLYNMKSEMEDIYFKFAEPVEYRAITNKLKAGERERQKLMEQFVEPLKQQLIDEGIKYKVKIRTKTAYSIWKKMKKQKVPFEGVFDVFAMRFIIDCEPVKELEHALCWKIFSLVTKEYESDTKRLRDWISNPKPNGYESLHITVKNKDNAYLEVQIRTKRMDETAERGLASHWSYKGIKHEATMDNWLNSVRYALEHPQEQGLYEDDSVQPPVKDVFVFTPAGELRKLPCGATVLDFAFSIHSNLGIHCTGGKINGKPAKMADQLKTGDIVEITSSKNQKPSSSWLNQVISPKARTKIKQKLSEMEFQKAADGKELLSRRLKNWKMEWSDEIMATIMKKLQYKTVNAFFAALGDGSLDVSDVKEMILSADNSTKTSVQDVSGPTVAQVVEGFIGGSGKAKESDDILVIDANNVKNLDYKMAKCCNPVFGDDVFGFVTIKDGIKIHRMSCPNAARLMELYPYRIQRVKWSENPGTSSFQTTLKLITDQDPTVLNQIFDIVNSFKASIRNFNVNENNRQGTFDITMKIAVTGNMELDKVISQLKNLNKILKVNRI